MDTLGAVAFSVRIFRLDLVERPFPESTVESFHGFYSLAFLSERQHDFHDKNMPSPNSFSRDPLHGITLESIIKHLVQRHGWSEMGRRIPVRCFQINPSVKSSLTFLRKTPWARAKVEDWFIAERFFEPIEPGKPSKPTN